MFTNRQVRIFIAVAAIEFILSPFSIFDRLPPKSNLDSDHLQARFTAVDDLPGHAGQFSPVSQGIGRLASLANLWDLGVPTSWLQTSWKWGSCLVAIFAQLGLLFRLIDLHMSHSLRNDIPVDGLDYDTITPEFSFYTIKSYTLLHTEPYFTLHKTISYPTHDRLLHYTKAYFTLHTTVFCTIPTHILHYTEYRSQLSPIHSQNALGNVVNDRSQKL
jgi:hypothetical protein